MSFFVAIFIILFFVILIVFFMAFGLISSLLGGVFSLFSSRNDKLHSNKDENEMDYSTKNGNFAGNNDDEAEVLVQSEEGARRMSKIKRMAEDAEYVEMKE